MGRGKLARKGKMKYFIIFLFCAIAPITAKPLEYWQFSNYPNAIGILVLYSDSQATYKERNSTRANCSLDSQSLTWSRSGDTLILHNRGCSEYLLKKGSVLSPLSSASNVANRCIWDTFMEVSSDSQFSFYSETIAHDCRHIQSQRSRSEFVDCLHFDDYSNPFSPAGSIYLGIGYRTNGSIGAEADIRFWRLVWATHAEYLFSHPGGYTSILFEVPHNRLIPNPIMHKIQIGPGVLYGYQNGRISNQNRKDVFLCARAVRQLGPIPIDLSFGGNYFPLANSLQLAISLRFNLVAFISI